MQYMTNEGDLVSADGACPCDHARDSDTVLTDRHKLLNNSNFFRKTRMLQAQIFRAKSET